MAKGAQKAQPDWWILVACIALLGIGLIMVFSATQYAAVYESGNAYSYLETQSVAAVIGLLAMFVAYKVSLRAIRVLTWPVGIIVLGFLIFMVASNSLSAAGGAERWMEIFGFRFQPSEFCKLVVPMCMARFLSDRQEQIKSFSKSFVPAIIMVGASSVLIVLQPDLSSGLVVATTGFIMMFCAGIRSAYLGGTVVVGIVAVVGAIVAAPYRLERVTSWLDPWSDPTDTGMQMVQSLLAFGNGGLSGVGLGAGGAKWFYLPHNHNDFIFSVLGEELGFIGAVLVVLIFVLLFWRGLMVAVHCDDVYGSLLALGITASLAVQTMINMGVTTGLLPVTGVTLPFISYGGTSLVISLTMVGVLLNVSRHTKRR